MRRSGFLLISCVAVAACSAAPGEADKTELQAEIERLEETVNDLTSELAQVTTTTRPSPATTSARQESTAAPTTTIDDGSGVLLDDYTWAEVSERVRNLQEFIGATTDGVYGPATRRAHVAELTARGLSTNAVPQPPVPAPGDSDSSEASPPATAAPDTSPSPTTTSPTAAPSTTVRQPVGTLEFASCSDCGQSLSSGSCANWVAYPVNSSDTSIEAMYFSPPGGEWWQYRYSSEVVVDANAAAVSVQLNLAPGEGRRVTFQSCTTTPAPAADWTYWNEAPGSVSFLWSTGVVGTACYAWGC